MFYMKSKLGLKVYFIEMYVNSFYQALLSFYLHRTRFYICGFNSLYCIVVYFQVYCISAAGYGCIMTVFLLCFFLYLAMELNFSGE